MHDAYGFDEIDVLLNTDAPNLREMDERFEKEFINIMRGRMAELGDDAVVEIVYRLVSELEDALCAARHSRVTLLPRVADKGAGAAGAGGRTSGEHGRSGMAAVSTTAELKPGYPP